VICELKIELLISPYKGECQHTEGVAPKYIIRVLFMEKSHLYLMITFLAPLASNFEGLKDR
jgi:hypothetical protein